MSCHQFSALRPMSAVAVLSASDATHWKDPKGRRNSPLPVSVGSLHGATAQHRAHAAPGRLHTVPRSRWLRQFQWQCTKIRPDHRQLLQPDVRKRQKVISRAPLTVMVDINPCREASCGVKLSCRNRVLAALSCWLLLEKTCRPFSTNDTQLHCLRSQPVVCIVSPQRQPELGPGSKHSIGFADAAARQIVNHNANVTFSRLIVTA